MGDKCKNLFARKYIKTCRPNTLPPMGWGEGAEVKNLFIAMNCMKCTAYTKNYAFDNPPHEVGGLKYNTVFC